MADNSGIKLVDDLLREIYATECDEYAESMYLCAESERRRDPIDMLFADFLSHRDSCNECRTLYEELLMMLDIEAKQELSVVAVSPPVSTSNANKRQQEQSQTAYTDPLIQGADWLLERTVAGAQLVIDLGLLAFGGLQMQTRSSNRREEKAETIGELTVDTSDVVDAFGLEVRIRLLADVENSTHATLSAEISLPERWPDFSGISVSLLMPDGTAMNKTTGSDGGVQFPNILRQLVSQMRFAVELPSG